MNIKRARPAIWALLLGLAVAVTMAASVTNAQAGTRSKVKMVAKRAAEKKVNRMGIGFGVRDWRASCKKRRSYWKCSVEPKSSRQCQGTLRIVKRKGKLRPRRVRIGCGE